MKNFKGYILMVALIAALCGWVFAGDVVIFQTEDTSPAIRARNNGDETVSIVTSGGGMTNYVVIGSVTNSIIDTGTGTNDTIALVAASLAACTNSSGEKVLTVDQYCSLAADSTDAELLAGTQTIAARSWGTAFVWDTTGPDFFSCYKPSFNRGGAGGECVLEKVYGHMVGAGDITVGIYLDRTKKAEWVIDTPVYMISTTNGIYAATSGDTIDKPFALTVPEGQSLMIRAKRASAATTGNIGALLQTK